MFQQIAQSPEKPGRIVIGKEGGRIEAKRAGEVLANAIDNGPGGAGGAAPPPPSVPPVSAARYATTGIPASALTSARAYSWFGPPSPLPRMVTRHRSVRPIRSPRALALGAKFFCHCRMRRSPPHAPHPRHRRRARCIRTQPRVSTSPRPSVNRLAAPPTRICCRQRQDRPASAFHWQHLAARG